MSSHPLWNDQATAAAPEGNAPAPPFRSERAPWSRLLSASHPAPFAVFHSRLAVLSRTLRRVRDGGAADVRDARVAARRVRDVLPLLPPHQPGSHHLEQRLQRMNRALGRVRDVDVTLQMAASIGRRRHDAAPAMALLYEAWVVRRVELMRQAIATVEKVDAEGLIRALGRCLPQAAFLDARQSGHATWERALRRALDARARACLQAVQQCTGRYCPRRAHRARITIRTLRYAVEFAHDTGQQHGDAVACLASAQAVLGELHDRQTLLEQLPEPDACGGADGMRRVAGIVSAESRALHAVYLTLRGRIVWLCQRQLNTKQP